MPVGGAEQNCRRADSIKYIYNQKVFEYDQFYPDVGMARGIRELARAFSNEMRRIHLGEVRNFEIGTDRHAKVPRRHILGQDNAFAIPAKHNDAECAPSSVCEGESWRF